MPIDLEALLQPIPGEQPSGADLRYHPISDQIKEARRFEDGASQGVWQRDVKTAEYPLVVKLSKEALTKLGKDLQICGWLTEALVHQEGFAGLAQGLELVERTLETYWDTVYPRIEEDGDMEMRATPLRWVASQLISAIRSVPLTRGGHNWYQYKESLTIPTEDDARADASKQIRRADALNDGAVSPEEFEKGFETTPAASIQKLYDDLGALLERVQRISTFCDEKFGDEAPDFGPMRNTLEELHQTARIFLIKKGGGQRQDQPVHAEGEEAAPEDMTVGTPEAAAPASQRRRVTGSGIDPSDADDAVERLLAAARYLRRENPYSVAPYLIARALRWGELRAAGGYPNAMFLAAPPTQVRMDLKRLAAEGAYEQVRDIAEEAAGQPWGRAWLDLQRYAVNAFRATGCDAAAQAIVSELKALLTEIPALPQWSLADDTPAANAETQQWLKDEAILPLAQTTPAPEWTPPPIAPVRNDVNGDLSEAAAPDAYDLAMGAARSGRTDEALEILSREIGQEHSGRGRFLRRVQLAQVCLATGHDEIGRPILEELADEIARRGLEAWENTDVIAQPLALLYRSLPNSDEAQEDRRKLYARLCRLDPARALSLHR